MCRIGLLLGWAFVFGLFCLFSRSSLAQQEVYHPGETYDSLQAGQDAYLDAEAERRAKIGRQIMLEEQILLQNTWQDPAVRYRPVTPESYGPIRPQYYAGPTLADVYAYPPTSAGRGGAGPVFQSWPRVPNDIWGTPYYGYVRQPIGHVKIWTGPLSYIYKPIYASPPMDPPQSAQPNAISSRYRGTAPRPTVRQARPDYLGPSEPATASRSAGRTVPPAPQPLAVTRGQEL